MTALPFTELHTAVYAVLTAGMRCRGYDAQHVPERDGMGNPVLPPYWTVGMPTAAEIHVLGGEDRDVFLTVHTWSLYVGSLEIYQLMQDCDRLVNTISAIAGYTVDYIHSEFAETIEDPDPRIAHGVQRFRFRISDHS